MTIEELAEAEEIVRAALVPTDKPLTHEQNKAAWTLAKAWLAEKCGEEIEVSIVKEDDGEKE